MIVLDTNVVSELMNHQPHPQVMQWVDAQPGQTLWLTAVTAAELLYGVARLPAGRRKDTIGEAVSALLEEDFADRILAFDATAATHYARVTSSRDDSGRPIGMADAQIAATCRAHGAAIATRNTRDFVGTGLDVIDPWTEQPRREA